MSRVALPALLVTLNAVTVPVTAQQIDTTFRPPIARPSFAVGTGPVVLIDQSHFNANDSTRYRPTIDLLRRDGYVVEILRGPLTSSALQHVRVLVSFIYGTSARAAINRLRQEDPNRTDVGAFSTEEIATLRDWVSRGGSFFLAIDHQPAPLAAESLTRAFGVHVLNGIAYIDPSARLTFRRADRTLSEHTITQGIDQVATFGGSALRLEAQGEPLLVLGAGVRLYAAADSSERPVEGWLQGVALERGRGRVVVFGEAGMFTAQINAPSTAMGMNAPIAKQNPQLLLNAILWLSAAR